MYTSTYVPLPGYLGSRDQARGSVVGQTETTFKSCLFHEYISLSYINSDF